MRLQLLGGCLALGMVWPAALAAQAKSVEAQLALGVRQVEEGDFESAATTLDAVARKLGPEKARAKDLARAYLYLAIAYLGLSEEAEAKARFLDALSSDPQLDLSPREFSPKIIYFFEQARRQYRKPDAPRPRPSAQAVAGFFEAVKRGDFSVVHDQLAEYPTLVEEKDPEFGATPLHWAALRGNEAVVGLLVAGGADPSATNTAGETALQVAERAKRTEVVGLLRPSGPIQRLVDAARLGDLARVRQLLGQEPALLNQKDARFGATPLHWAALRGHREVVEFLLQQGADRGLRNGQGETPLQVAVRARRNDLVPLLRLDGGAPGEGPAGAAGDIFEAAKAGDLKTVRRIVEADASVLDQRDGQFGATPLHWAALRGHRDVVAYLVSAGAEVDATNNSGETAEQVARRAGRNDVVDLLRGARR